MMRPPSATRNQARGISNSSQNQTSSTTPTRNKSVSFPKDNVVQGQKASVVSSAVPKTRLPPSVNQKPSNSPQKVNFQQPQSAAAARKPATIRTPSSNSNKGQNSQNNQGKNKNSGHINSDISNALSPMRKAVRKAEGLVLHEKQMKAASLIQRQWKKYQKQCLMKLANEAIKMTDEMYRQRKYKLQKDNFGLMDSIDSFNVVKDEDLVGQKGDFNVFAGVVQQEVMKESRSNQKQKEREYAYNVDSDWPAPSMRNDKKKEEQRVVQESEDDIQMGGTFGQTRGNEEGDNKLAALNQMLKNRKLETGVRQSEDDFEQFLQNMSNARKADLGEKLSDEKPKKSAKNQTQPQPVDDFQKRLDQHRQKSYQDETTMGGGLSSDDFTLGYGSKLKPSSTQMAMMMLESEGEDDEAKLISPPDKQRFHQKNLSSVMETSQEESTHRAVRPFSSTPDDSISMTQKSHLSSTVQSKQNASVTSQLDKEFQLRSERTTGSQFKSERSAERYKTAQPPLADTLKSAQSKATDQDSRDSPDFYQLDDVEAPSLSNFDPRQQKNKDIGQQQVAIPNYMVKETNEQEKPIKQQAKKSDVVKKLDLNQDVNSLLARAEQQQKQYESQASLPVLQSDSKSPSKHYSNMKPSQDHTTNPIDSCTARKSQQSSRIDDFMSFLDNVENELDQSVTNRSVITATQLNNQQDNSVIKNVDQVLAMVQAPPASHRPSHQVSEFNTNAEVSMMTGDGVSMRERLVELELEREEQAKALALMKKLREKDKNTQLQNISVIQTEAEKQQEMIKTEMTDRMQKQVKMIEDLLNDKKDLKSKLEQLLVERKQSVNDLEKHKKIQEDQFKVELQKNKEAWQAADKVRRERWEKEKIADIRAQTVKGLEPEIQRIIERNKDELRKQSDLHQEELRSRRKEFQDEFERKLTQQKEKFMSEKEESLDKERERGQAKLHEQYERLEQQFESERRRWKESQYSETSRVEQMLKSENESLKAEMVQFKLKLKQELQTKQSECEEQIQTAQRRQEKQMKQDREKLMIEQEEMRAALMKQQQDQYMDLQRKAKQDMVIERNREIEAIIEKLGDETHANQKALVQKYEQKIATMVQQHDEALKIHKSELTQLADKCSTEVDTKQMLDDNLKVLSRRINDQEIELQDKQSRLEQSQKKQQELQNKLDNVYEETGQARQRIEQKMLEAIEDKDAEIRRLTAEKQEIEHELKSEIDQMSLQSRQELQMIQDRVQAALGKKKETIDQLGEEVRIRDLQITKLKDMLQRQRAEILLQQ